MSVAREDNICTITFEEENWKEEAPEVFVVTDGAVPFYSADTWKYKEKNTFRSGKISDNGTSETSIKVIYEEEGTLNFNCAVSSEQSYDKLHVLIDGTEKVTLSGTADFKEYEFAMTAGEHTIIFRYTKDGSQSRDNDAGAIGYIKFTGVQQPYETRYLMADFNNKVYTVVNGKTEEIPSLERKDLLTKGVFQEFGIEKPPTSEQLTSLTKPVVFRWCEKEIKPMQLKAVSTPRKQTIRGVADLSHETVHGIISITSVYKGNVMVSYSFDDVTYTEPITLEDFLKIDVNTLYAGTVNKKIYFKFVLLDRSSSLTNFVITYNNK